MATARRSGSYNSFWDNVVTGAGGTSTIVHLPQWTNKLAIYLKTSGVTTFTIQAAHDGNLTAEAIEADTSPVTASWGAVTYLGTALSYVFAGSGTAVWLIPDWVPEWIRLASSANVTVTAGHEAIGD